jgi:hypothetical protein
VPHPVSERPPARDVARARGHCDLTFRVAGVVIADSVRLHEPPYPGTLPLPMRTI